MIIGIFLFWQVKIVFYRLNPTQHIDSPENDENNSYEFNRGDSSSYTKKFLSPDPWSDKFIRRTDIFEHDDTESDNQNTNKKMHT